MISKLRIGIFGGSFDPIHNGHIEIIKKGISQLELDILYVIPVSKAPHKEKLPFTDSRYRLEMLKLALNEISNVKISDIEIKRGGTSYTIDTIKQLQQFYPDAKFFLLIGSDMVLTLDMWKDIEEIKSMCGFVVITRPGFVIDRQYLRLEIDPLDISSSAIRNLYKTTGSAINFVSEKVEAYIKKNNLYKT